MQLLSHGFGWSVELSVVIVCWVDFWSIADLQERFYQFAGFGFVLAAPRLGVMNEKVFDIRKKVPLQLR